MSTAQTISYAQRFEDLYLMRCFGGRAEGFYIDIGSGHPVYDNMSFRSISRDGAALPLNQIPGSRA